MAKSTRVRSDQGTAAALIPDRPSLPRLRVAASTCQACDLWKTGTQTVFGEGRAGAELMLVGEAPGAQEDLAGRPFVGPSGRLLDQALEAAGIDRADVYITNAVKHFKWEARGARRIPAKPGAREIAACKPWLEAEIAAVKPRAIVCLGAVAAQALFGKDFRVTKSRGELVQSPWAPIAAATVHPASILRAPDGETRRLETQRFIDDLTAVARALAGGAKLRRAG